VADAFEHVELDVVVARRHIVCRSNVHEPVVLTVEQQRGPLRCRNGKVVVQTTSQVEEHRARRLGVGGWCLGIRIALRGERNEAKAKVRIETGRVVEAPLEARVHEPFGAEQSSSGTDHAPSYR